MSDTVPANPLCGWVGLALTAAADPSGRGLARAGGGLGAEEILAGRGPVEPPSLVPFDPVWPLCRLCSPQLQWRPGSSVLLKPTRHVGRSALFTCPRTAARLGGGKRLLIIPF